MINLEDEKTRKWCKMKSYLSCPDEKIVWHVLRMTNLGGFPRCRWEVKSPQLFTWKSWFFCWMAKQKYRDFNKKMQQNTKYMFCLKHHSEIFEQSHCFFSIIRCAAFLLIQKNPDLHLKLNGKTNAYLVTEGVVALIILVASRFLGDPIYKYTSTEQWKKTGLFKVYGGWNPTHLWVDYNKPL